MSLPNGGPFPLSSTVRARYHVDLTGGLGTMQPIDIAWDACLVPPVSPMPADVAARAKKAYGSVLDMTKRLSHVPWVVQAGFELDAHPLSEVPYELADLLHLVVSQDNSCRYCYGSARTMLRILGRSDDEVARLETNLASAETSPAEKAALEYARLVSRANPRPGPKEESALREIGFSPGAVEELAVFVTGIVVSNRLMTLLAIQPDPFEQLPDRWYGSLLKPVLRHMMTKGRKRGPRQPFAPGENTGLFASVLDAVDGVPRAKALRRIIDAAYASEILPRKTKLWMTATVGRAVGCPAAEADSVRELTALGFAPEAVERVLRNLGGPEIDALETRLVSLARESVRCQPKFIQERVRAATAGLTPAQVVETAGICAVANGMARLSVLLNRCG